MRKRSEVAKPTQPEPAAAALPRPVLATTATWQEKRLDAVFTAYSDSVTKFPGALEREWPDLHAALKELFEP